jgi:AbrB family looped-hinge helix DNA binding protein
MEGQITMSEIATVRVDAKGRVALPLRLRRRLGIEQGTMLFVQESGGELRFRRAENPFDSLAERAEAELHAGETTNLRDYAAEHGIALDDE